jgi:hypothetical protein
LEKARPKSAPLAANTRLKALKALFAWACEETGIGPQNPTLDVFAYDLSWSRNWVACSRQPASATGSATNAIKSICISSAHGVRKATAAALPEAGKSVHELAAVTGH